MATVLISGGTGIVGTHLSKKLKQKGYDVFILGRKEDLQAAIPVYKWNVEKKELPDELIAKADHIIHLAGTAIADEKWTDERKKLIIDSRVRSAELLFNKVKENDTKLKSFTTASGIGYYGVKTTEQIFKETDPPEKDFIGHTCDLWEQAADKFKEAGIRTIKLRTGVVLTKNGGALAKMLSPVQLGIGSELGSGQQYMPWIHIEDICSIYIKTIEDEKMEGAYNAVAPEHCTNKEFMKTLAKVLDKPFWLPAVPGAILKLLLGEMSEIVLKGSRVSAEKIIKAEYKFLFPHLEDCFHDLLK